MLPTGSQPWRCALTGAEARYPDARYGAGKPMTRTVMMRGAVLVLLAGLSACAAPNLAGPNYTNTILQAPAPASAAQKSQECINLDAEIDRQQDIARQGATDTSMPAATRDAIAAASAKNIAALQAKGASLQCGPPAP